MRKIPADMMAMMARWRAEDGELSPLERSVDSLSGGVTRYRNESYLDRVAPRDRVRSLLDVYTPSPPAAAERSAPQPAAVPTSPPDETRGGRPSLVMWVHGGGWRLGGKDDLAGLYGRSGRTLVARRGVCFANINYRLTPRVQHPGHIEDVAAAFHWLTRNADRFGYDPASIFLAGHSAGAHLVALLATDPAWLGEYGLEIHSHIRGVIAISGIYDLREMRTFLAEELEDGVAGKPPDHPLARAGAAIPPEASSAASPIAHVSEATAANTPPFLLMHEEHWEFARDQAREMSRRLDAAGVERETVEVFGRNHTSILGDLVNDASAPSRAIDRFLDRHDDRR